MVLTVLSSRFRLNLALHSQGISVVYLGFMNAKIKLYSSLLFTIIGQLVTIWLLFLNVSIIENALFRYFFPIVLWPAAPVDIIFIVLVVGTLSFWISWYGLLSTKKVFLLTMMVLLSGTIAERLATNATSLILYFLLLVITSVGGVFAGRKFANFLKSDHNLDKATTSVVPGYFAILLAVLLVAIGVQEFEGENFAMLIPYRDWRLSFSPYVVSIMLLLLLLSQHAYSAFNVAHSSFRRKVNAAILPHIPELAAIMSIVVWYGFLWTIQFMVSVGLHSTVLDKWFVKFIFADSMEYAQCTLVAKCSASIIVLACFLCCCIGGTLMGIGIRHLAGTKRNPRQSEVF